MSRWKSVVHLTYGEGLSSVFASQVARPMSMLRNRGHDVRLVVFAPVGQIARRKPRRAWGRQQAVLKQVYQLPAMRLPAPPSRLKGLWNEARLLGFWLRRRTHGDGGTTILHCRGARATNIALDAASESSGLRIVFDCRGLNGAELLLASGYRQADDAPEALQRRARMVQRAEMRAATMADAVVCVSEAMKREICASWSVSPKKVTVVPCCTNAEHGAAAAATRDAQRQRLGLTGRFVVAYCGSLAAWQMPELCLALVRDLAACRRNIHFLGITTSPDRLNRVADEAGIARDRRTILRVPQQDVATYLAAADLGLLPRERHVVNRVSSPVKFAEYLAAGVPVAISPEVGDYSNLVRKRQLGVVLEREDSARAAVQVAAWFDAPARSGCRERCIDTAGELLAWPATLARIERTYARFQPARLSAVS